MDLFLAPFLLLLGWVVRFLRALSLLPFLPLCISSLAFFFFLFGPVDGYNFISCSFGLNILACISILIFHFV